LGERLVVLQAHHERLSEQYYHLSISAHFTIALKLKCEPCILGSAMTDILQKILTVKAQEIAAVKVNCSWETMRAKAEQA
jgi:hypothetical protein